MKNKSPDKRGIALVAVLAILVVLSILASTMIVNMQIEKKTSEASQQEQTLDLLAFSAIEHTIAILSIADDDDVNRLKILNRSFRSKNTNRWINVCDSLGNLCGRYRITVEDEAGKINLNNAWLLHSSKGDGWNTGEINFPKALGLRIANAKKLLDFRYGPNGLPGTRIDDDRNNPFLMADGIDNNANGIIDEEDEGVNDPGEYNAKFLCGDDRAFMSINETLRVLESIFPKNLSPAERKKALNEIARRATVHSTDYPGSQTLQNSSPSDINAMTARQCKKRLRKANTKDPFERSSKSLDSLTANLIDYRDENHVLSTVGSQYGVEQICFNELLANDGMQSQPPFTQMMLGGGSDDQKDWIYENSILFRIRSTDHDTRIQKYYINKNKWKYIDSGDSVWRLDAIKSWDVEIIKNGKHVQLLGPAENRYGKPVWMAGAQKGWKRFCDIQESIGKYGKLTMRGDAGFGKKVKYQTVKWPKNFFKNQYISIGYTDPEKDKGSDWYKAVKLPPTSKQAIKITESTVNGQLTLESAVGPTNGLISRCILWNWGGGTYPICATPDCMTRITVQKLEPGKYYLPSVACLWDETANLGLGFGPVDKISGNIRQPRSHRLDYGGDGSDAIPVRTGKRGNLNLYLKSSSDTSPSKMPTIGSFAFIRPEVIELINIGSHPVSLKGWTLMFNSGSVANNIGVIDSAQSYKFNNGRPDFNPTIMPNKYFYLVNNMKLFNSEFGNGKPDNKWGASAEQNFPVWEIPSGSWGVQYKITKAVKDKNSNIGGNGRMPRIYVQNANFKKDQFKGEILEFIDSDHKSSFDGTRYRIVYSGKDWFAVATGSDWPDHLKSLQPPNCDKVMLVGMPAKGGIVSMTLKNEYQQIAARTVEYSYLDRAPESWYGYSSEKIDPSGYNWVVQKKPTIGGQTYLAQNRSSRRNTSMMPHVKNGPFVSIGEIQRVSADGDFKNVGSGRSKGEAKRAIKAMANVFCSSIIRLNAADETTERKGWDSTLKTVTSVKNGIVTTKNAKWEIDQWKGQTLRFMTGKMRGECFPIFGNTKNSLLLTKQNDSQKPHSTPGIKILSASKDDLFSIGPGYKTPLCFTRKENCKGEWTWKKRISTPGNYDLYLFGLNDAISTTEFLEENNNAPLDIEVWNFITKSYDLLCKNQKYNKSDEIYAGKIKPENISNGGDFKLRLTPHQLIDSASEDIKDILSNSSSKQRKNTGYAWFNYAVITPVPVNGRVNVNTAPARLLSCLPGMNNKLAKNIAEGKGDDDKSTLKPYKQLGDLLDVRGMTLKHFRRIANLVCVSSSAYTINVELQVTKDLNRDGIFSKNEGDKILAERRKRIIIAGKENSHGKKIYSVVD